MKSKTSNNAIPILTKKVNVSETLDSLLSEASRQNPELCVLGMSATLVINNLYEAKALLGMTRGEKFDGLNQYGIIGMLRNFCCALLATLGIMSVCCSFGAFIRHLHPYPMNTFFAPIFKNARSIDP
jgi:hypothetical protein